MLYTIYLEDDKVETNLITSVELTSDITDMFMRCRIQLNNLAARTFNNVKTGMNIKLVIEDDDKDVYRINLKLLKFNKIPGNQNILKDILIIDAISSYYFSNYPETLCHTGNISEIIKTIVNNKYRKLFNKIEINDTEDTVRVRYQIGENTLDFVKRILKYGRIKGLPIYLYPTLKGDLKLFGIYDMIKQNTEYYFVAPSDSGTTSKSKTEVIMAGYRFFSNVQDSASKIKTIFSNDLFIPYTIKLGRSTVLSDTEIGNSQSETLSPPRVLYMPWYYTPEDSYSTAVKQNFEANIDTYKVVVMVKSVFIKKIDVGSLVHIRIPKELSSSNEYYPLGEGDYIVKNCAIKISPTNQTTRYELIQANYASTT